MASFDPKEFPAITPGAGQKDEKKISVSVSLSGKTLGEMIEKTLFASSPDESRLNLSGVYLEALPNGKLRLVSSDGHRLAIIERETGIVDADSWPHAILPRKGLLEARKLLEKDEGETHLSFHGSTAVIKKGTTELSMRLIEGEFPDYQQVVPKEKKDFISFSREEFLSAIRRLLVLTTERARGVKLQVEKEKMTVSVNTPDLGEGEEEIEIENKGGNIIIGFNGRYLTEVLNVIDEGVRIKLYLKDEVSPGLLQAGEDEDFSYIIMPMRIF
jgi:DNA polymerase-3 subunit beta